MSEKIVKLHSLKVQRQEIGDCYAFAASRVITRIIKNVLIDKFEINDESNTCHLFFNMIKKEEMKEPEQGHRQEYTYDSLLHLLKKKCGNKIITPDYFNAFLLHYYIYHYLREHNLTFRGKLVGGVPTILLTLPYITGIYLEESNSNLYLLCRDGPYGLGKIKKYLDISIFKEFNKRISSEYTYYYFKSHCLHLKNILEPTILSLINEILKTSYIYLTCHNIRIGHAIVITKCDTKNKTIHIVNSASPLLEKDDDELITDVKSLGYLNTMSSATMYYFTKSNHKLPEYYVISPTLQYTIPLKSIPDDLFLGYIHLFEQPKKAFQHFLKMKDTNNPNINYYLGLCYCSGIGVAKNTDMGMTYFQKNLNMYCINNEIKPPQPQPQPQPRIKVKRCPNGTRRNKKTKLCESIKKKVEREDENKDEEKKRDDVSISINDFINTYIHNNKVVLTPQETVNVVDDLTEFSNLFDDNVKPIIEKLNRLQTIGDGSCFLHALFTCVSPTYRRIRSSNDKTRMAQYFRREILAKMPDKDYVSDPSLLISQLINPLKIVEYKKRFNNMSYYLTDEEIQLISNKYRINFLIFVENSSGAYAELLSPLQLSFIYVDNEQNNSSQYEWIFVHNRAPSHYEAVRYNDDVYILKPNDGDDIRKNADKKFQYRGGKRIK